MKTVHHFNRNQVTALEELLSQRELLLELIEDTYAINTDTAKLLRDLPDDSHVSIVGGWDEIGALLIIHCAESANSVVITGAYGFASIGRPDLFD